MRTGLAVVVAFALMAPAASAHTLDLASGYVVATTVAQDCGACSAGVLDCARVTDQRVDCRVSEDGSVCDFGVATRLLPSGRLEYGTPSCAAGSRPQQWIPVYPDAFDFAGDTHFKPGESTPYGKTIWLGRVPWHVTAFHGTASNGDDVTLHLSGRRLVPIAYMSLSVPCEAVGGVLGVGVWFSGAFPARNLISHTVVTKTTDGTVFSRTRYSVRLDSLRHRITGTVSYSDAKGCATQTRFRAVSIR